MSIPPPHSESISMCQYLHDHEDSNIHSADSAKKLTFLNTSNYSRKHMQAKMTSQGSRIKQNLSIFFTRLSLSFSLKLS